MAHKIKEQLQVELAETGSQSLKMDFLHIPVNSEQWLISMGGVICGYYNTTAKKVWYIYPMLGGMFSIK